MVTAENGAIDTRCFANRVPSDKSVTNWLTPRHLPALNRQRRAIEELALATYACELARGRFVSCGSDTNSFVVLPARSIKTVALRPEKLVKTRSENSFRYELGLDLPEFAPFGISTSKEKYGFTDSQFPSRGSSK